MLAIGHNFGECSIRVFNTFFISFEVVSSVSLDFFSLCFSLVTFLRQTSYDPSIRRQDYGLIRGLQTSHTIFAGGVTHLGSIFTGTNRKGGPNYRIRPELRAVHSYNNWFLDIILHSKFHAQLNARLDHFVTDI